MYGAVHLFPPWHTLAPVWTPSWFVGLAGDEGLPSGAAGVGGQ